MSLQRVGIDASKGSIDRVAIAERRLTPVGRGGEKEDEWCERVETEASHGSKIRPALYGEKRALSVAERTAPIRVMGTPALPHFRFPSPWCLLGGHYLEV